MLKSMTAYGRASLTCAVGRIVVEIQSVNRKHLEINAIYPNRLTRYDGDFKKWVSAAIARGQITMRLSIYSEETSPIAVAPNLPLAKELFAAWKGIGSAIGLPLKDETVFSLLNSSQDIMLYEDAPVDEKVLFQSLKAVVEEALKKLVEMKIIEGKALFNDIGSRLKKMEEIIKIVADKAPGASEKYRVKLLERINEVAAGGQETDERILREVCLFAEKIDTSEEITRFNSHLSQAFQLIGSGAPGVGKTLEFLIQEFNREINTIGSKASDIEVTRAVVEIKSELEKIREQIQNVE